MRPEDADAVYDTASTALFESMEEREVLRRRTPEQVENCKSRYGTSFGATPKERGWPKTKGASRAWRSRSGANGSGFSPYSPWTPTTAARASAGSSSNAP